MADLASLLLMTSAAPFSCAGDTPSSGRTKRVPWPPLLAVPLCRPAPPRSSSTAKPWSASTRRVEQPYATPCSARARRARPTRPEGTGSTASSALLPSAHLPLPRFCQKLSPCAWPRTLSSTTTDPPVLLLPGSERRERVLTEPPATTCLNKIGKFKESGNDDIHGIFA